MNNDNKNHALNYLKKNIRYDGRKKLEYREIKVETSISKSAEGSAKVQIGDTLVLAGVKFEVGQPYPDKQDEGTMMVNAELLPLSNPEFESGPPKIEAIELARVIDRGIRESGAIDTKKLCIKKGELVWTVIVDLIPLNVEGNLFDAFALAGMLAIKNAKFPKLVGDKIDYKTLTKNPVPLKSEPVSVTVWKIGENYIVDPIQEEQEISDARLTVASLKDGTLCAMQKGGEEALSIKDIETMIDIALDKAKELRKYLK